MISNKMPIPSRKTNITPTDDKCYEVPAYLTSDLLKMAFTTEEIGSMQSSHTESNADGNFSEEDTFSEDQDSDNQTTWAEEEGIKYIAGYVAFCVRDINPNLGSITKLDPNPDEGQLSWIRTLPHGCLTELSEQWCSLVKEFEKVFIELHGPLFMFNGQSGIVKMLKSRLHSQFPNVYKESIHVYARLRTFIRIREVNREQCYNKRKQTKNAIKWVKSKK